MNRFLSGLAGVSGCVVVVGACARGTVIEEQVDDGGTMTQTDASMPMGCQSCAPGEVCSMGKCAKGCSAGELKCGMNCVDYKNDPTNCGTCGYTCPQGWGCVTGKCQLMCAPPATPCFTTDDAGADAGPMCIDTGKDPNNCGACGNVCMNMVAHGQPGCVGGMCGVGTCDADFADCNKMAMDGCEADLNDDANNCGMCGNKCPMNTPVCSMKKCIASSCGNNKIDPMERCDGSLGVPMGGQVACYPGGTKNECKWDFSKVPQLYCNGSCSWAGAQDCDQADADIFCKLLTGNSASTAMSFQVVTALAQGGFSCPNIGTNLGPIQEYGVNQNVWYQGTSILGNHGPGHVITNVVCK
jgi:hypothetical protein